MCVHYLIRTLVPVALLVVWGMSIYIVISKGPMWSTNGYRIVDKCDNWWWTNMLFISNLVPYKNSFDSDSYQCLPWFWYISTEVQFFFISLCIIWVFRKNKTIGVISASSIGILGLLVSFLVIYFDKRIVSLPQYDSNSYTNIFTKPWS
jgi:peptidoglycan/LPS O-acetylase OafA/YrhL